MDGLRVATAGLAVLLGGTLGGLALGNFATTTPRGPADPLALAEHVGNPRAAFGDAGGFDAGFSDSGRAEPVECKGCGPGIEERRRVYAFGYDDSVVQEYLRYRPPPPLDPSPPLTAEPAPIESFAPAADAILAQPALPTDLSVIEAVAH